MPFVNEALVHLLLQETAGFDMVAPRLNGYWEPLLTVYHKRLLPSIEKQLKNGSWKEEEFTGTGFPNAFYIRYHMYKDYFPLQALSKYRRLSYKKSLKGD